MTRTETKGKRKRTTTTKQNTSNSSLPEIRDIDQISSALNFKNGGPRLQRIVWDKIKKFK